MVQAKKQPPFFGQQLDPDANYMAAFTTKDPTDREAFTAHWTRIFGDETQDEAHPDVLAGHVKQLLAGIGRAEIPVGAGRATPLEGTNAFPEPWRESSDSFWGVSFPQAPAPNQPVPAAELLVETLTSSSQPVMVFVSGNHTNLAEVLRLDPGIVEHIKALAAGILGR